MKILLITFNSPDELRQQDIVERIKKLSGVWARLTPTTWCIKTERKTADVRDDISNNVCCNEDKLFVVEITTSAWASYCLPKEVAEWMKAK